MAALISFTKYACTFVNVFVLRKPHLEKSALFEYSRNPGSASPGNGHYNNKNKGEKLKTCHWTQQNNQYKTNVKLHNICLSYQPSMYRVLINSSHIVQCAFACPTEQKPNLLTSRYYSQSLWPHAYAKCCPLFDNDSPRLTGFQFRKNAHHLSMFTFIFCPSSIKELQFVDRFLDLIKSCHSSAGIHHSLKRVPIHPRVSVIY